MKRNVEGCGMYSMQGGRDGRDMYQKFIRSFSWAPSREQAIGKTEVQKGE